jgi:hypothetical protein
MRGPHVSLCCGDGLRGKVGLLGCGGPDAGTGCAAEKRENGLGCQRSWAGKEEKRGGKRKRVFQFQNPLKQMNSNQDLNPNTQKQCTSMNATVNSYISLIN